MENKKEYLNEERYQKNKKKITIVAVLVLIIGLLVGGGLIFTGLKKNQESKLNPEQITSVQTEIDDYQIQLSSLRAQKSQEFMANQFSEKYYNLENQITKLEEKIDELQDSLNPDNSYLTVYYMFGGFIVIATLMISGSIYATAKRREINAFYTQQQIPVAQEGIEKMAPSVGGAVKEIAKGIKEGINEADNKEEK